MDKTTEYMTEIKQAIQQIRDFDAATPNAKALLEQLQEDVRSLEEYLKK